MSPPKRSITQAPSAAQPQKQPKQRLKDRPKNPPFHCLQIWRFLLTHRPIASVIALSAVIGFIAVEFIAVESTNIQSTTIKSNHLTPLSFDTELSTNAIVIEPQTKAITLEPLNHSSPSSDRPEDTP